MVLGRREAAGHPGWLLGLMDISCISKQMQNRVLQSQRVAVLVHPLGPPARHSTLHAAQPRRWDGEGHPNSTACRGQPRHGLLLATGADSSRCACQTAWRPA